MTIDDVKKLVNEAKEIHLAEPDLSILRQGRRKPPVFPLDIFGDKLKTWLSDAAHSSGAPVGYVIGALLAASSALIGNARCISPWEGWDQPSSLWIGLVGDPSSNKSPAIKPIRNIIRTIENDMAHGFECQQREWQTKKAVAEIVEAKWKKDLEAAIGNGGDKRPIKPEEAIISEEPISPRILVNDTTIEQLFFLLSAHEKGLLLHSDELAGWFGSFDRYGGDGVDRPLWLKIYDAEYHKVDRIKHHNKPVCIERSLVSVIGGVQPEKLAKLVHCVDDGLTSRFLWIWPERIAPFRPNRITDHPLLETTLRRLSSLKLNQDVDGKKRPQTLMLSEEAAQCFQEWRIENNAAEENVCGLIKSSYGKAAGHILTPIMD